MTAAPALTRHLVVRELRHAYAKREALAGLDLDVARGEMVGLLGPNGSGKSTALALIAGLIRVRRGAVTWHDGRGVAHPVESRGYRGCMGMVFQHPSLDRQLSARHNLVLAGRMQGLPRAHAAARAEALLTWSGLADRADDAVSAYSGGMQRRLELARALVHTPELLLLDEPTTGLDFASVERTWELIARLRAEQAVTVVLATHRPDEAAQCDRLVVLAEGRPVRVDTPDALIAELADDLVVIEASDPGPLADAISRDLGFTARVDSAGRVLVECTRGHEVIVRLVEGLPPGRLDAISLRRPTLADVFAKLTGARLDAEAPAEAA